MTLGRRVAVLIAAGLVLCAAGPTVTYHGTGTVLALLPPPSDLHATRPVIVIEHDPIAGLMAERMPFRSSPGRPTSSSGCLPADGSPSGSRTSLARLSSWRSGRSRPPPGPAGAALTGPQPLRLP